MSDVTLSDSTNPETTLTGTPPPDAPANTRRVDPWRLLGRYGALVVLVVLIGSVAAAEPATFATTDNALNILSQMALSAILAMGLTFPLVAGEFDLSVGYTASFAGVLAGKLIQDHGASIPVALLGAIVVGGLVGLVNGMVVTALRVNALVATLGVGTVVVGINYAAAGGLPVTITRHADSFIGLTLGRFLGIPYPVYVMVGLAIVLWILLNRTVVGQSMQAVGGNAVAARLSGVRVDRVRVTAFVLAGVCAAIAGVLLASRTGSAATDGADSYLLGGYAAAFFGSAVLRNGQFHIIGTLVGVLTVAVGFNAIALIGLATYYQYLFQGTLLILGVGVATLARRRSG